MITVSNWNVVVHSPIVRVSPPTAVSVSSGFSWVTTALKLVRRVGGTHIRATTVGRSQLLRSGTSSRKAPNGPRRDRRHRLQHHALHPHPRDDRGLRPVIR